MIQYAGFEEQITTSDSQFTIEWLDKGRKAKNPPDPAFPTGVVLADPMLQPGDAACGIDLPYPATGVGSWMITCKKCGKKVACTAAGRPDDPLSMLLKCKKQLPQI